MNVTKEEAARTLAGWEKILVLSHASPDGDTLGSAAGLLRGLRSLGKETAFLCADPAGRQYRFLFEGLETAPVPEETYHIVAVDVADARLLGSLQEQYGSRVELVVDHHGTHVPFGEQEWVEPDSASTCQMVLRLLMELGVDITPTIADCLYTGLATDTGCFRYGVMKPDSHRAAAELIALGARAAELNRLLFETKSRAYLEVEREVLREMQFYHGGKVALITLPKALLESSGAEESELEGLASLPRCVEGVIVGITLKEKSGGVWKASLRAIPPADASKICEKFGGGGHKGAAGCTLETDPRQAAELLIAACGEHLKAVLAG